MTTPTAIKDDQVSTRLDGAIEAVLASVDKPLTLDRLIEILITGGLVEQTEDPRAHDSEIEAAVARLNAVYERTARAFRVEKLSGGYRLMTTPEHAGVIAATHRSRTSARLSRPALETLSIVAYRQPVTRAELEAIRGVGCGEVLRALLDRKLIKVVGRAEELGRPMLYGTTKTFLDVFGLSSIADLPSDGVIAGATERTPKTATGPEPERKDS